MRVAELDAVFPSSSKGEEVSMEIVELSAFPLGSTPPFPKTAPTGDWFSSSLLLERVWSRGGVGDQSVNMKEGLDWKCGMLGTTGEMSGTGIDGPGSSGWSRDCISTRGPSGSSDGNIGTKVSYLASVSSSLRYSSLLEPGLAAHMTMQALYMQIRQLTL